MAYNFVPTEIFECFTHSPELAPKFTACLQT